MQIYSEMIFSTEDKKPYRSGSLTSWLPNQLTPWLAVGGYVREPYLRNEGKVFLFLAPPVNHQF